MTIATRCRANNPSTCWKHGTGISTVLSGAKKTLESAQEEFALTESKDLDEYKENKAAIERYTRRVAYLSGKPIEGNSTIAREEYEEDLYKELIREEFRNDKISDTEKEILETPAYIALARMKTASPAEHLYHYNNKFESSSGLYPEETDWMNSSLQKGIDAREEEAKKLETEGYDRISVASTDGVSESYYYYKYDTSDPKGYAAWRETRQKHIDRIIPILHTVANKSRHQSEAYYNRLRRNRFVRSMFRSEGPGY